MSLIICSLQNQQIQAIETELEGYKRQILKAQEQNEQLTYMHNRIKSDISAVKKQTAVCLNQHEAIKIEYSTYNRALHETETQLGRVQTVCTLKASFHFDRFVRRPKRAIVFFIYPRIK